MGREIIVEKGSSKHAHAGTKKVVRVTGPCSRGRSGWFSSNFRMEGGGMREIDRSVADSDPRKMVGPRFGNLHHRV